MSNKREMPVAVCTKCGKYSYEQINVQCSNDLSGKRCKGIFRSHLKDDDWRECPSCAATGRDEDVKCTQCEGAGWLVARGKF